MKNFPLSLIIVSALFLPLGLTQGCVEESKPYIHHIQKLSIDGKKIVDLEEAILVKLEDEQRGASDPEVISLVEKRNAIAVRYNKLVAHINSIKPASIPDYAEIGLVSIRKVTND